MNWIGQLQQFHRQIIPSFWFLVTLSFTFLSFTYAVYDAHDYTDQLPYLSMILFTLLPLCWFLIFFERWFDYVFSTESFSWRQQTYQYALASLIPPLRFGHLKQQQVWVFGWKPADANHLDQLEQRFLYPILLIALIVLLPLQLLSIWMPSVAQQSWLMHIQLLSMSLVMTLWIIELAIMLGTSPKSSRYLVNHWLDLFIFVYPLAALNRLIHVFGLQAYYNWIDNYIVRFMFLLKIIFLGLSAVLIQYYQTDEGMRSLHYLEEMQWVLFGLWIVFAIERFLYLSLCPNKTWRSFVAAFFITLFPPLHLAARRCHKKQYIWYFSHWELVREELFDKIERQFLFWIMLVLVIMTPIWLAELFFAHYLKDYILFHHAMNIGNAVVWAVFVAEFVIEISLTKKWQKYIIQHWVELLIILLPMLAFARFLRLTQFGFLAKYGFIQKMVVNYSVKWQKLLNVYRARSTMNRLIRIFILIDVIKRWQQSRNPKKYLQKLHEQLEEKQQELDEIKKKIAETEKLIDD
ncbi:hypothetical protein [Candidatus Albibeggiatoa sp. nov. NOAA]|uniref:hypothetical protein n=1 Tax=Candidatus Albibeggiatoa sp. nov. NOAA TaxID=3162724 RepID=UPI0032FB50DF|nr:hypothetical protein [Thiotrichaceae bacterium]